MVSDRNPYAPPAAALADPLTAAARPRSVACAIALIAVSLVLAPVRAALRADWHDPAATLTAIVPLAAVAPLWLYGLQRRSRLLWGFTVLSGAIGAAAIPWSVARLGAVPDLLLYCTQCAAVAPATVLLCLRPARRWFRVSPA